MLADIMQRNRAFNLVNTRKRRAQREAKKTHQQRVWDCADAVFLAVHEGKPQPEIDALLARLAIATGQAV